ncbi:MAG: CDP-alcohol phosphatidyltransferase family protein [Epulopiscium sp.]|jgi:phosphatidylglycerophosphate synthase|nr:CDP-alcohol phosphatidyltransferase family protein [Candidatus Epulonipiscium sp.]
MANIITSIRIICNVVLLFCPTLSPAFYSLYLVAGFSDMIDGVVARKTNTVSEFGSTLDTFADFVFVVVCLIKLIPIMDIPVWLYLWIAIIAFIKGINVVSGYVMQRKFVAVHTVMNKVTGALLFILPLTLSIMDLKYSALVVCTIATFAAVQEGHYIRTEREG